MNLYQVSLMDISQAKFITLVVKATDEKDAKNQFKQYLTNQGVKFKSTSIKVARYLE